MAAVIPGYHGNLLEVDLCTGKTTSRRLERQILQHSIGGTELGLRLLWDELAPGIDPLSTDAGTG